MKDNYAEIAKKNLGKLYAELPHDIAENLPCEKKGNRLTFNAFGKKCCITPEGIKLNGVTPPSPLCILISLYALGASGETLIAEPFRAFKEFPDTMPYVGAFVTHTEMPLIPEAAAIKAKQDVIKARLDGKNAPRGINGDFSFIVTPLPKISLCYIFYEADEDFDASVTCLFSSNAIRFLPMDGLADLGEYTSKSILEISG